MHHRNSRHAVFISCNLCLKIFKDYHVYRQHTSRAHHYMRTKPRRKGRTPGKDAGPPTDCSICFTKFSSTAGMLNHKSKVHDIPLKCNVCPKTFKTTYLLKYHLIRHETLLSRRKWHCSVCSTTFATRKKLHSHFAIDHESSHGCDRCGQVYASLQSLRQHMRDDCEFAMQCDTCGHKTINKQSMKIHQIIHFKTEDVYVCSVCSKKFITRESLEKHVPLHLDEECKFTCEVCGKPYTKYGSFQKHRMLFHPQVFGRTIYRCPSCQFVTKSQETIERHKETHTVAKHVCDFCGKALSCSTALKIHRNIHTGVKPYACKVCGKKFSSPNYLRKHRRVHVPSMRYISCRNCLHSFSDTCYKSHITLCCGESNEAVSCLNQSSAVKTSC